jgi:preprotein translocase subunit SecY
VLLAVVQGWGFALFTSSLENAVISPGFGFKLQMVLFLTAGAIFVMWLGEQITERGLGNGASLIIFFSIVERFWPGIFSTFRFVQTQAVGLFSLLVLAIVMIAVVAATVAVTMAARRVMIQIPQRTMARGRMREAAKNFIPLRVNASGVMPIIFAQSVIVVPGAIAQFSGNPQAQRLAEYFQPGTTLYYILSAVLIVFFTYFYTSIIFNPIDLSENLKKQGGFIPGVKPGSKTAEYIDHVVTRITLPGAIFLTFIALWRNVAPDRCRRGARYDGSDPAAPAAQKVRRVHEEGPCTISRSSGDGRLLSRPSHDCRTARPAWSGQGNTG